MSGAESADAVVDMAARTPPRVKSSFVVAIRRIWRFLRIRELAGKQILQLDRHGRCPRRVGIRRWRYGRARPETEV